MVSFLAAIIFILPTPSFSLPSEPCAVSLVLVGSTGDLARRYLWPAIFQSYMERNCLPPSSLPNPADYTKCDLVVVGGSRGTVRGDVGDMWEGLLGGVNCQTVSCELCLNKFKSSSFRAKIGDEEDYKEISRLLTDVYKKLNRTEVGRIFYLSVPPSAYINIVPYIHIHSRPDSRAWLRVVLEKPFGHNLSSAKLLASKLAENLAEEEVYRVDHYLGKLGVQQVLPFRRGNSVKLQLLWNKAHVQYVQVSVRERLDVKGRSGFFDKYGIIRDLHQNHLTEVLSRLLMDMPDESGKDFHQRKMDFLTKLYPPTLQHSILGQYVSYQTHLSQDDVQNLNSSTPTYAAIALYSRDPKWNGIPFLLSAGKQLNERKVLARIVFKQWKFSLVDTPLLTCPAEIIFLIQDEEFGRPGVLISQHFFEMGLEYQNWESMQINIRMGSNCSYLFLSPVHEISSNAYVPLLDDVLNGKKASFVDTGSLLTSWEVWDPLLDEIEKAGNDLRLLQYSPEDLTTLDFHIETSKLVPEVAATANLSKTGFFSFDDSSSSTNDSCVEVYSHSGLPCIVGTKQHISACLAKQLHDSASRSFVESGAFHLALPGGGSSRLLLNSLSLKYAETFPFQHTHIWQTDERCVNRNDSDSNWNQIDELLLSQVRIPFHHLHPMPVDLQGGLCTPEDNGCVLYEKQLRDVIGSARLDHIVLGVGKDGHVASLFPSHKLAPPISPSANGLVRLIQQKDVATPAVKRRMTLSLDAILSAGVLSVIIMGEGKQEIARMVMDGPANTDMPIFKLLEASNKEHIILYIAT